MRYLISMQFTFLLTASVSAATINVPADQPTIQDAVNVAVDGDEIVVAPGTYTGSGNNVVDLLGKEIVVRSSNGPGLTIIDGQGARRGVAFSGGETSSTVLKGFTILNGLAPSTNDEGGGIWCAANAAPVISQCTVTENVAWFGSGMMIRGAASITDCEISHNNSPNNASVNSYGGGIYCLGDASISGCAIFDNGSYWGGGVTFLGSNGLLEGCTVSANNSTQGGGVYVRDLSPIIDSCVITGNNSQIGGGVYLFSDSSPSLLNCTISDNASSTTGGGLACYLHGLTTIENCTVSDNTSLGNGGGIWVYLSQANMTVTNCRITGNSQGGVYSDTGLITISDSLICSNEPYQLQGPWNDGFGNEVLADCTVGACCSGDDCAVLTLVECLGIAGSTWLGDGTVCEECLAIQEGACCLQDGFKAGGCVLTDFMTCDSLGGDWQGVGSDCTACIPPPQPGGCCVPTGCLLLSEEDCMMLGGLWLGDGVPCTACPPVGACCSCDGCLVTWEADCIALGGDWLAGLPCEDCPLPCPADVNDDGVVDGADLTLILSLWGVCP